MGQREAGRPSNYKTGANPTVNRLQGGIRAVVRKAAATWRQPQAGRPRGGRPASLWVIWASSFAETLLCSCAFSREVSC